MARHPLLVGVLLAAACESHPNVNFRDTESVPFAILFTSPSDADTEIALDSNVTIVFSRELDEDSIDAQSFSIALDGTSLNATVGADDHVATLTPDTSLESLRDYEVTLTTEILSVDASALASDLTFTFTTRDLVWQSLAIPNPAPGTTDSFGYPTAVGTNFVVAVILDDLTGAANAGSVYLYDGTTGSLILAIPNPDPDLNENFGNVVTAVGPNFVVGTYKDDPGGFGDAGSVALHSGTSGALITALPNPAPAVGDSFGSAVTAVGSNFVVAAYLDVVGAVGAAGSVHLYDGETGALIMGIPNPAPLSGDRFGEGVVAVGENFVILAPRDDPSGVADAGSAYLYSGTTGNLILAIPNPAPQTDDLFGARATAIGGNFVVAAEKDNPGGIADAGSVYLYSGTTGALILAIPNPNPLANDQFGFPGITAAGGNLVVGAQYDDPMSVVDAGSVYLFNGTTGTLILEVPNPAPVASDRFGFAITAVAENFVVGAPFDDAVGLLDSGSAHVYSAATGTLVESVENPTPATGDLFGFAILALGSDFIATSRNDSPRGLGAAGSVYLFDGASGSLVRHFPNPEPDADDQFGATAIATVGENFVVAALLDDPDGVDRAGSVYLFALR